MWCLDTCTTVTNGVTVDLTNNGFCQDGAPAGNLEAQELKALAQEIRVDVQDKKN